MTFAQSLRPLARALTAAALVSLAACSSSPKNEDAQATAAALAAGSGLRGLVCSPLEIARLRQILPAHVQLVTPGIRPADSKADDQKRTLTPKEALAAGASWLVIGRPICAAPSPRAAAETILASL